MDVAFVKKELREEAKRLRNMGELERDLEKIFTPKYFIPPETRAKFYDFLVDVLDMVHGRWYYVIEAKMSFPVLLLELNGGEMYIDLTDSGEVEIHIPEYTYRVMALLGLVLLVAKKHYPHVDVYIHRYYVIDPSTLEALQKGGFKRLDYYTMHKRFVFA